MTVYDEIKAERERQDAQWGGAAHDDTHVPNDWIVYITNQLGKACGARDIGDWRARMVKVAALAIAAAQSAERMMIRALPDEETP